MLKIRLKRVGRRHDPSYRIVVVESSRAAKSGRSREVLGSYDPRKKQEEAASLKAERLQHWLSCGAKPSLTVHNILARAGRGVQSPTKNALPHRRPIVNKGAGEGAVVVA
ncbi:MAG: 30S ribosomal protein S16 [bacterium]|nr:30S ribosomal protein S16 [bacterium]MDZ4284669.1 30S ribosomal protein S16 [Patescibacteria group bacterium]